MPALESVTLSGASELDFTGFEGERLAITATGAVDIEGEASRYGALELAMTGAGQADLREMAVTDAEISLAGAADVTLQMAGGALTGGMSGAGRVRYYGPVREQSIATTGVATVERGD
jgi:hypothetical protein